MIGIVITYLVIVIANAILTELVGFSWNDLIVSLGKFNWGDLIAALGFFGAITTFMYQMCKNRKENRETQRQLWYLDIIVKPNIEKIESFYILLYKTVCEKIVNVKSPTNTLDANKLKKQKRQDVSSIMKIISDNQEPIESTIRSYDNELGTQISDINNQLIDLVSRQFELYAKISEDDIRLEIMTHKQMLMSALYNGLSSIGS